MRVSDVTGAKATWTAVPPVRARSPRRCRGTDRSNSQTAARARADRRERKRGLAIADHERSAVVHLLQRAGQDGGDALLGHRRRRGEIGPAQILRSGANDRQRLDGERESNSEGDSPAQDDLPRNRMSSVPIRSVHAHWLKRGPAAPPPPGRRPAPDRAPSRIWRRPQPPANCRSRWWRCGPYRGTGRCRGSAAGRLPGCRTA